MKRFALGLLAANVTATYLATFLVLLYNPGPFAVETGLDLLKFIPLGAVAILSFWFPLFVGSILLVLLLSAVGTQTYWVYASGGAVLGIGFALAVKQGVFYDAWEPWAIGLVSGAAGGWIYWRIAIGQRIVTADNR